MTDPLFVMPTEETSPRSSPKTGALDRSGALLILGLPCAILKKMEIWMKTGGDLERERKRRGLTAPELARLAGLFGTYRVRQDERHPEDSNSSELRISSDRI